MAIDRLDTLIKYVAVRATQGPRPGKLYGESMHGYAHVRVFSRPGGTVKALPKKKARARKTQKPPSPHARLAEGRA